jgi:hypothetical protein
MLSTCIRLNLDCSEICATAGRLALTQSPLADAVIQASGMASMACAKECERHAERMEHCRVCALACRSCELACKSLLNVH